MSDSTEESRARLREITEKHYGGWKEKYDLMAQDYPEVLELWMKARQSVNKGALSTLQKELIVIGAEISMRHNNIEAHTFRAMEAGATPQMIAEVVGISMMIHGMVTYVEVGARALKVAYAYQKDPSGVRKQFEALREGWDSGHTRWAPGGA